MRAGFTATARGAAVVRIGIGIECRAGDACGERSADGSGTGAASPSLPPAASPAAAESGASSAGPIKVTANGGGSRGGQADESPAASRPKASAWTASAKAHAASAGRQRRPARRAIPPNESSCIEAFQ
jgi:hypothetical protein